MDGKRLSMRKVGMEGLEGLNGLVSCFVVSCGYRCGCRYILVVGGGMDGRVHDDRDGASCFMVVIVVVVYGV